MTGSQPLVVHITGARPNFPKAAPVIRALGALGVRQVLVHTGQNYDYELNQVFFDDVRVPVWEKAAFNAPKATVYSNVTAQPHTDVASIKRLLVDQIVKPVRWEQTMQHAATTVST